MIRATYKHNLTVRVLSQFLIAASVAVPLFVSNAIASEWPKLSFGKRVAQCQEPLTLARLAFSAKNPVIGQPPELPQGLKVLNESDSQTFEDIGCPYNPEINQNSFRNLYWERNPSLNFRLVVRVDNSGWQYETVSFYAIDTQLTAAELIEDIKLSPQGKEKYPPVFTDSDGLMIALSSGAGALWVVDEGPLNGVLADWRIFIAGPSGFKQQCTIQFRPPNKSAYNLLPQPVAHWAGLVLETVGSGAGEGSLNQTGRIKRDAEAALVNAALRPWSLKEPYNSIGTVEAGLRDWSARVVARKRLYQSIKESREAAQGALGLYYEKYLNLAPTEAKDLAFKALDIVFRTHYMFHQE